MGAIELNETDLWPQTTAGQGFILRTVDADGLLGIAGSALREIAIWIEPPESALGLRDFDHARRTAGAEDHGGDFDVTVEIHGLRRCCRAAIGGSLEMLLPLYAPDDQTLLRTDAGSQLQSRRELFVVCAHRERLAREIAAAHARLSGLRLPASPALRALIDDFDADVVRVLKPAPEEALQRWMVETYLARWGAAWQPTGLE